MRILVGKALPAFWVLLFIWTIALTLAKDDQSALCAETPAGDAPKRIYSPRDTLRGVVVDEQDHPVSGVRVVELWMSIQKSDRGVVSGADGRFRIGAEAGRWQRNAILVARTEDGTRQGWLAVHETHAVPLPAEIVLKAARRVTVSVADSAGRPVAEAVVDVIASHESVAVETTDAEGKATLAIPADAPVGWIVALKSGVGFDYFENYVAFPTSDRGPPPEDVSLVLDGARPVVQVETKTPEGRPIPGVMVGPWSIQKPGKISYVNLSGGAGARSSWQTTDRDGKTQFTWLPERITRGVTFLSRHDRYTNSEQLGLKPAGTAHLVTVTMKPNGTIHGKVTLPDGSPAPNVLLQAEGNGGGFYYRGYMRTGEDGTYAFSVYADQSYAVQVLDDDWAAASHSGENVRLGDAPHEVNFTLLRGTLIEGTLMIGPDNEPAAEETATLGAGNGAQLWRWATTDQSGHYRFRVGPGEYQLVLPHGMGVDRLPIKVTDQVSIVHDGHAQRRARGPLSGTVRRESDGSVVPRTLIWGETTDRTAGHAGFHTTCDGDGAFATERWNDAMLAIARDPATGLAGWTSLAPDDKECAIELSPGASIAGRVVDEARMPLANAQIQCTVAVPANEAAVGGEPFKQAASINFNLAVDNEGRYSVTALPVGSRVTIIAALNDATARWETGIGDTKEIAADDIVVKAAPPEQDNK